MSDQQDEEPPSLPTPSPQPFLKQYVARELIGQGVEAIIIHDGERYRLRITNNNKLILTK
jgi:hemin uptake protein HemP